MVQRTHNKIIKPLMVLFLIVSGLYSQEFIVNTEKSTLTWEAEKLSGKHNGGLIVKSGKFIIKDNRIISGLLEADMTTIVDFDIEVEKYRLRLENHLRSPDFFSVDSFPTAVFNFKSGSPLDKDTYLLKGDMTIKGITHAIEFKAAIKMDDDSATATGTMILDRTKWNVRHRSAFFFPDIGDRIIYDNFNVGFKIVAERE